MTARSLPFAGSVSSAFSTWSAPGSGRATSSCAAVGASRPVFVPARGAWPKSFKAQTNEQLEQLLDCRAVLGDLVVDGEVDSLSCLAGLEHVGGDFVIQSTKLRDLEGLETLRRVEGDLSVGDNPALRSLDALGGLEAVGRSVFVWANDSLVDLAGLHSLGFVPRHLEIWGNTGLRSLAGLEQVVSVGGDLSIGTTDFGNESLRSLAALRALRFVGGELGVCLNPSLLRLDGLEQLMRVSGNLVVRGNDRLRHVRALCSLEHVGGDLVVEYNIRLADLEGLDALRELSGEVLIAANPQLEQLDALAALHARRVATRRSLEREDTVPVRLPRD